MSPTIEPHRLLSFSFFPSPLPPREDKIADYFVPLPVPGVSSDAALPATPPYSTHYATLDYANFRLSLSVFTFLYSIPFSRLLPVPPCPSRPGLSRFYPYLVRDPAPTCNIARLPRAFTSRNARSSLQRAYYTDGVYAEYHARSDSLTRRCRVNVPSCDPTVNHLIRLLHRDFFCNFVSLFLRGELELLRRSRSNRTSKRIKCPFFFQRRSV